MWQKNRSTIAALEALQRPSHTVSVRVVDQDPDEMQQYVDWSAQLRHTQHRDGRHGLDRVGCLQHPQLDLALVVVVVVVDKQRQQHWRRTIFKQYEQQQQQQQQRHQQFTYRFDNVGERGRAARAPRVAAQLRRRGVQKGAQCGRQVPHAQGGLVQAERRRQQQPQVPAHDRLEHTLELESALTVVVVVEAVDEPTRCDDELGELFLARLAPSRRH